MKNRVSRAAVILYAVTAVIWLLLCVRDLFSTGRTDGLRVLVAAVWIAAFFAQLLRYRRQ